MCSKHKIIKKKSINLFYKKIKVCKTKIFLLGCFKHLLSKLQLNKDTPDSQSSKLNPIFSLLHIHK